MLETYIFAVVVDIHLFVADIDLCEDVVGGVWCKSLNYMLRIMVAFRLVLPSSTSCRSDDGTLIFKLTCFFHNLMLVIFAHLSELSPLCSFGGF